MHWWYKWQTIILATAVGLLHNMFYTAMTTHSWLLELLCITLKIPALYDMDYFGFRGYLFVRSQYLPVLFQFQSYLYQVSKSQILGREVFNFLFKDPACHFQRNLLIPYMYYLFCTLQWLSFHICDVIDNFTFLVKTLLSGQTEFIICCRSTDGTVYKWSLQKETRLIVKPVILLSIMRKGSQLSFWYRYVMNANSIYWISWFVQSLLQ